MIRGLAERVEREHSQHLRDAQRIEDRSAIANPAKNVTGLGSPFSGNASPDFETLVGAGGSKGMGLNGAASTNHSSNTSLEDDLWGNILGADVSRHNYFLEDFVEQL